MSPLGSFLGKVFSRDRRRADRLPAPELAAYFWTGAAPLEHPIRDISSTGLFLVTTDTWFPGTLMMITLQHNSSAEGDAKRAIVIQTRVVRRDDDGVGLAFIFVDRSDSRRGKILLKGGADRKTLDTFLKGFVADQGRAIVNTVVPPGE